MASGSDDPALRVQWHGPDTVVLRQGKSVHAEAPFLFLLLGTERALLLDTGAEANPEDFPLRATVDHLVDTWLERHEITSRYPLVVAHSHPHDDHVTGDRQLADRPDTTIVGHDAAAVAACFGPEGWRSPASTTRRARSSSRTSRRCSSVRIGWRPFAPPRTQRSVRRGGTSSTTW